MPARRKDRTRSPLSAHDSQAAMGHPAPTHSPHSGVKRNRKSVTVAGEIPTKRRKMGEEEEKSEEDEEREESEESEGDGKGGVTEVTEENEMSEGSEDNDKDEQGEESEKGEKSKKSEKSYEAVDNSAALENDVFIQKIHARPIHKRYILIQKLGEGGFGAVYLGKDITDGRKVALKLEHHSRHPSILSDEAEMCKEFQDVEGFPDIYWYGQHDDYRVMAFELLGPSLEDLFAFCDFQFSFKTVFMLMHQLLYRLEALHKRGIVHRDIKPQNCLMGDGINGNTVYITDLGLAENAQLDETSSGTAPTKPRLIGTARYASIRGHAGQVQSFKEDLESLGYMVIYFLRGELPWQGIKAPRKEKDAMVMEKKKNTTVEELCKGLPEEFAEYMEYVGQLRHGEMPKYRELRKRLRRRAKKDGIEYDHVFDWTKLLFLQQQERMSD